VKHESGFSLLEFLIGVAIVGLCSAIALPAFATYRRHASVQAAAAETMTTLRNVRAQAISGARNIGIKFTQTGSAWSYALYEDGDGDGVRNDDITSGIDRRLTPVRPLMPQLHVARVGLLPFAMRDPDGDALSPNDSPVAFGRSTICTFGPLGTATAGTVYLVDDTGELYCVRVAGPTGRLRFLRYDSGARRWEDR